MYKIFVHHANLGSICVFILLEYNLKRVVIITGSHIPKGRFKELI